MTSSRRRNLIIGLVALVLAFNATLWFLSNRAAEGSSLLESTSNDSDQLIAAVGAPGNSVITTSRSNEVILYDGELNQVASTTLDDTVGAVSPGPDGSYLIGTSTGSVTSYTSSLEARDTVSIDGRVLAIASNDNGFYVAHGVGAFGIRFYISHFAAGATEPDVTYQVAQPVTAMVPWQDGVVFGTASSYVGYFTATSPDAPAWMTLLKQAVSRVDAMAGMDGILVGDEKGNLTRLAADGSEMWTTSIGDYPVRGMAYDPASSSVMAGNGNGKLTMLDADGTITYERSVAGTSDLEAILPAGGDSWIVVPRSGTWQMLDPAAASGAANAATIRAVWIAGNGLLALLAGATAIAVVDRWRVPFARTLRQVWKARIAYLFILPAIGLILLFSYYPSAMAFYYSFTNYSLRSITTWVGLDNYQQILFEDQYFRTGIVNMLIITITSMIKTLTVPLLIAELIFWLRNHWHSYIFRTLFILPTVVPGLVFTLMWRQVYDPDTGLLNELLGAVGLEQWQTAWLGNPDTALWAIIGVGFPWVDAFALLILLGGLLNINGDYFDAAKVDGASVWQRFRNIDLPLLVPQFRILLFFAIAGTIQGFVAIFILTRGGPGMSTYIPALQMYMRISDGDFGYASAVGVILFVLILIATFFVLRLRRNDGVETA